MNCGSFDPSVETTHLSRRLSPFGGSHQDEASEGLSVTTSASYQNKVTLTTPGTMPAGRYIIMWNYEWNLTALGREFQARVRVGSDDLLEHAEETLNTTSWGHIGGFAERDYPAGSITITLDWRRSGGAPINVRIRKARLVIWRVG